MICTPGLVCPLPPGKSCMTDISGAATNIVARHINGIRTQKGVPVRVMCDPTTITNDPGKCHEAVCVVLFLALTVVAGFQDSFAKMDRSWRRQWATCKGRCVPCTYLRQFRRLFVIYILLVILFVGPLRPIPLNFPRPKWTEQPRVNLESHHIAPTSTTTRTQPPKPHIQGPVSSVYEIGRH